MGYRTIAINQIIDGNDLEQKKKKKKGETRQTPSDPVPEPFKVTAVLVYAYILFCFHCSKYYIFRVVKI